MDQAIMQSFDLQLFADEAEAFNAWHAVAPYIRDKIDRF